MLMRYGEKALERSAPRPEATATTSDGGSPEGWRGALHCGYRVTHLRAESGRSLERFWNRAVDPKRYFFTPRLSQGRGKQSVS
jgi:hypothetical protein